MPSPVLHCAAGAAIHCFNRSLPVADRRRCGALLLLAAMLPDFDFLPGLLLGDPNRFHGELTHSLGFAVVAAVFLGLFVRRRRGRMTMLLFVAVFSHVVLDTLVQDKRPPYGVPMLWPVSDARFHADFAPLPGIQHGSDEVPVGEFLNRVFSADNFRTAGIEAVLGALLIGVCAVLSRFLTSPTDTTHPTDESAETTRRAENQTLKEG